MTLTTSQRLTALETLTKTHTTQIAALTARVTKLETPVVPPPPVSSMPTANLPGWTLAFNDDFLTPVPLGQWPAAVSAKWDAYPYPWKDYTGGTYWPEKTFSQHDSMLDYYLHSEGGVWVNGAPVPKIGNQLYGRFAARLQVQPGAAGLKGYYAAWLLWPQSETWPRDGEIDFPEGGLTGSISGFMHHQGATAGSDQDAFPTAVPFIGGWHDIVTEWTPSAVRYYLDGTLIGTSTSRLPNTPMHWVMQVTLDPAGPPAAGVDGHILVDWVAAWTYAP